MTKTVTTHDYLRAILDDLDTLDPTPCLDWPYASDRDGYGLVYLEGRTSRAHILACEMMFGPRPTGMVAAHSCGRPQCFNPYHLRWATHSENQMDRVAHGTSNRGSRHASAKLTEDQVREIRRMMAGMRRSNADIARQFGVHPSLLSKMKTGRAWGWLND